MEKIEINVADGEQGTRLDVFISKMIEKVTRSYAKKLIDQGLVRIDGQYAKISAKLKQGQKVEVILPAPKKLEVTAQNIPIEVLYEDNDIVVVNKPKGMVVHPACGNYTGTLVNAIMHKCHQLSGINGVVRPGIVHRIDKDTTGVLVIAKNDNAHLKLSSQLKEHTMKRRYIALVYGCIKNQKGTINAPIGRHKIERKKMSVIKEGRTAVTHFDVIEYFKEYTLIKAVLETGRTHQIRVHMAYIGHPLVGDEVYGPKRQKIKIHGQLLHAELLGFKHPSTDEYMEFSAPLPQEFSSIIDKIRERR